jgi:comEA protein
MEENEKNSEKVKERIGIILLVGIVFLAGVILIRDKEVPIKETNNSSFSSSETENSKNNNSSQQPANSKEVKSASTETKTGKININSASIEDLDTLPGIGEVTAQKIIDYRTKNGKFKTVEEIKEVNGIGEAKFNAIKNLISI